MKLYHHAQATKTKIGDSLRKYYACAAKDKQKGDCYVFCPCATRIHGKKIMVVPKGTAHPKEGAEKTHKAKLMSRHHFLLNKDKWVDYKKWKGQQKKFIDEPNPGYFEMLKKQKSQYDKDRYKKIKSGDWQPKKK